MKAESIVLSAEARAKAMSAGIAEGKRSLASEVWAAVVDMILSAGGALEYDPGEDKRAPILEMIARLGDVVQGHGVDIETFKDLEGDWTMDRERQMAACKPGAAPYMVRVVRRAVWWVPFDSATAAYDYWACAVSNKKDVIEADEPRRIRLAEVD